MTDDKQAARARGQALRGERAARARKIRRAVISGAVALFVAAWLMITIVLVSGHDPALASKTSTGSSATTVASTPSADTNTTTATTTTTTTPTTATSSGSADSGSGSSGVSSVTTSQS
jgi:cytoskeletal protein RodZ